MSLFVTGTLCSVAERLRLKARVIIRVCVSILFKSVLVSMSARQSTSSSTASDHSFVTCAHSVGLSGVNDIICALVPRPFLPDEISIRKSTGVLYELNAQL